LDEIEKAHPDIFNLLLQVLDDGILTDGLGRRVDFRNTIIIMTSNVGAKELRDFGAGVGFSTSAKSAQSFDHMKSTLEGAMRKVFRPEFLNRIDDVIIFKPLEKEHILRIVDLTLGHVVKRIEALGLKIEIDDEVKNFLAEKGYDAQYGARPLNRAVQKYVEDPVADEILKAQSQNTGKLKLTLDKEAQKVVIEHIPADIPAATV
ncbi:MAG: AAA family ATPase, partial [Bacteroidia bacterium]|nr:AAA family ATPase [Bacteroidia bacterium]